MKYITSKKLNKCALFLNHTFIWFKASSALGFSGLGLVHYVSCQITMSGKSRKTPTRKHMHPPGYLYSLNFKDIDCVNGNTGLKQS